MSCETETGYITMADGSEVSYDALPNTNFRLLIPKLPWVTMFLQGFETPPINVDVVQRPTQYIDVQEIGEKIVYGDVQITFLVDKNLKNYKEIFAWMKRMTVAGTQVGESDNPILVINGKEIMRFVEAWPKALTNLNFITNANDVQYLTATATFNLDYFEFVE